MDKFAALFGHDPLTAANHTGVEESIYWADARLTGSRTVFYNLLTRFHNWGKYRGHIEGDRYFWGDLCRQRIKYFRNFVFRDINTLKICPYMPYYDPLETLGEPWFASADGHDCRPSIAVRRGRPGSFGQARRRVYHVHALCQRIQREGKLNARFSGTDETSGQKNGWFVPVATLLDYLAAVHGRTEISDSQRRRLERKWLCEKIITGPN